MIHRKTGSRSATSTERRTFALSSQLSETRQPLSTQKGPPSVTEEKLEQAAQHLAVIRAPQGDEKAFGDIVDQYSTLLLRTATMIVADQTIAEDVVQEAFIQAWHHLPDVSEAGTLYLWLICLVVKQCITFKRRLARTTPFVRQILSELEINLRWQRADSYERHLEHDWDLTHALDNLPEKQRIVIVLHYYNGMTLSEMAQILQASENTLKKRLQTAQNKLHRRLHFAPMDEDMG